jgi:transcriptional regulator with XRE-family HTH domain
MLVFCVLQAQLAVVFLFIHFHSDNLLKIKAFCMTKQLEKRITTQLLFSKKEKQLFGERLRSVVPERGISEFARNAGMAESTVRSIMKGNSVPRLDKLISMVETAEVNYEWLITGNGPISDARNQAVNAELSVNPDSPIPIESSEFKVKSEAIGVLLRRSRTLVDQAERDASFSPPSIVQEGLKTLVFMSLAKGEITEEGLLLLLDSLKQAYGE